MACAVPQSCSPRVKQLIRIYLAFPTLLFFAFLVYSALRGLPMWITLLSGAALCVLIWSEICLPSIYCERFFYTRHKEWIKIERGVLWHTVTLIPRGQILCVRVRRDPAERILGLCTAVFITPAGRVYLPGLTQEDAARMRELLPQNDG